MLTAHNVQNYKPSSVGSHPPQSPANSIHASPAAPSIPPSPHQMQSPASVPPSPAQHQFSAPSPAQPPSPANAYLAMKSPASLPPPPSPANIYYSTKSPASHAPPKSPQGGIRSNPTTGPPVLSPQPVAVSQNSVFYAAPSPSGSVLSGASLVPGTVLAGNQLGMQSLQLHPNGTIVSGGQVFQIQLQPNVSVPGLITTSAVSKNQVQQTQSQSYSVNNSKGKQPQLLPKPSSNPSQQGAVRVSSNLATQPTSVTANLGATVPSSPQQQIFINQSGLISNVQAGTTPIIMGQMMTQAATGQAATPMIIQQPSGSPMIVLRPNAPTIQTAPTIVPIAAAQPGLTGQLILQQGQSRGILASNQQVKIVPQNQVQMQQIQTPSGPKLIALPLGQALIPGQNLVANPSSGGVQINPGATGQLQIQAATNFSTASILPASSQGFTLQATPTTQPSNIVTNIPIGVKVTSVLHQSSGGSVTTILPNTNEPQQTGTGNVIAGQTVIQQHKSYDPSLSPPKKKKSKKKKRDMEEEAPVPPPPKSGTVDLGALMKDVGLDLDDLDGFSMDNQEGSSGIDVGYQPSVPTVLNTSQESTSSSESDLTPAQNPVNTVEMLQGNQAPSHQLSLSQAQTSQPSQLISPQVVYNTPTKPAFQSIQQQSVRMTTPPQLVTPGSSFQLIQGPDGQFILQTNPSAASATATATSVPEPIGAGQTSLSEATRSNAVTPPRALPRVASGPRQPADPNRTPLMEDDTLPPGWHRKVSQRKSGASAGRYEVFIIGPTGKRFRSRNELKSFFEKTGETSLNPDDFDFSTFGRNNQKVQALLFFLNLLTISFE